MAWYTWYWHVASAVCVVCVAIGMHEHHESTIHMPSQHITFIEQIHQDNSAQQMHWHWPQSPADCPPFAAPLALSLKNLHTSWPYTSCETALGQAPLLPRHSNPAHEHRQGKVVMSCSTLQQALPLRFTGGFHYSCPMTQLYKSTLHLHGNRMCSTADCYHSMPGTPSATMPPIQRLCACLLQFSARLTSARSVAQHRAEAVSLTESADNVAVLLLGDAVVACASVSS